jgi:hypothetical protein
MKKATKITLGVIGGVVVVGAIGNATGHSNTSAATPKPAVTITAQAAPAPTVTVTAPAPTVTVTVTAQPPKPTPPKLSTAAQLCKSQIGIEVSNTITGNITGTIKQFSDPMLIATHNSAGNEVASCTFTDSNGSSFSATVTKFADGTIGWTSN